MAHEKRSKKGTSRRAKTGGKVKRSEGERTSADTPDPSCSKYRKPRDYTHAQELIDNLPYITMTVLGAVILLLALDLTLVGWLAAVGFVLYGIVGTLWFIVFICPYCHFFGTRLCPCGYGQIAVRFRKKAPVEMFREKFRRHIPVIFPMWFIPVIAAGYYLWVGYDPMMLALLVAFCVDAFVALPLVSRLYGCAHCEQKDDCPWMV